MISIIPTLIIFKIKFEFFSFKFKNRLPISIETQMRTFRMAGLEPATTISDPDGHVLLSISIIFLNNNGLSKGLSS
jgi:hypothetical protein